MPCDLMHIFKVCLETMLEEDEIETAYLLRSLAEEIETEGAPSREDVLSIISLLMEEEEYGD